MALASLGLSIFSLLVPFGIAAIVMAHFSRSQIAKSGGHLRGKWPAFAALVIGYPLTLIGITLFLAVLGTIDQFNRELGKNPGERAALVYKLMHKDPNEVSVANAPRDRQRALDALRILRTREEEYLAADHPGPGYTCQLRDLGYDPSEPSELRDLITTSHYHIQIAQCGLPGEHRYVIYATGGIDHVTADFPAYCMDSRGVMDAYVTDQATNDMVARVFGRDPEVCPEGERVDLP